MPISKPAAERLARLARLLEQRVDAGRTERVSSSELARMTGFPSHTIRKDISQLSPARVQADFAMDSGARGGTGFSTTAGYEPDALAARIRCALGFQGEAWNCCVMGLGRLGSSFLCYGGLEGTPFRLCAGFDTNVNRIEILESDIPLYPTFRMKEVIPRLDIRIALLCVPEGAAQEAAAKLFSLKVLGLVNFTSAVISPPAGAAVQNVSVIDSLEALAAGISFNKKATYKEILQ